VQGMEEFRLCI